MGLADTFASDPADIPHPHAGCGVGRLLQRLADPEAAALRDAMADPAWRTTSIVKALNDDGYQLTAHTVGRHRRAVYEGRDGCQCQAAGLT